MSRRPGSDGVVAKAALRVVVAALLAADALAEVHGRPECTDASPVPQQLRLVFDAVASRGPLQLQGETEIWLTVRDGHYELRSETRSLLYGARQASSGQVGPDRLIPHRYREQVLRREERVATFDWIAGTVRFSNNGATEPLPPLAQDRLSMLLHLGRLARAQPRAQGHEIPVAGVRRVSTYRIEARGVRTQTVASGQFRAYGFARVTDDDHDALEVWLAPDLCWLPVKMRFASERGVVVVNELREARFD
jgi:hypothetical protein